jgi:DNA-directed RNA polymerase subunit RPC12/RpoP
MLFTTWYDTVMRYNKGNSATHKKCPKCGVRKERSEYWNDASRPDGITAYCKPCKNEVTIKHVNKNFQYYKNSWRAYDLKKKYNLSVDQFEEMMKAQNYKCHICKKSLKKYSAVDHNHKTRKVRGILCRKCNLGLGSAKDNVKILKNMIKYLEAHENL